MIYLDYNATTPTDPRVLEAMLPFFTDVYANPASDHQMGAHSKSAVDSARDAVAVLLNARADEIIFTSGATEANNLAILGCAPKLQANGRTHVVSSAIEHPAVLEPLLALERAGWEVTILKPDSTGKIAPEDIAAAVTEKTGLVSLMFANNEIGTIQDMAAIGQITRARGIYFHTDAAQAAGNIPIDVDALNIDLLSLSGHKFYAPKGIGALFVRSRQPRVKLTPIVHGGGQERGFRSGTLNVPLIVGMGHAAALAKKEMKKRALRLSRLADLLRTELTKALPNVSFNGHPVDRLVHTLNIELPGIDNKWLLLRLGNFCFSTGSACSTLHDIPSHVLLAIGLNQERIENCIRVGLGSLTTEDNIRDFVASLSSLQQEPLS